MSKKKAREPLTWEEIFALTTMQLRRQACENSAYWQKRADAILKLDNPTAGQLKARPWFEQHSQIWGAFAEKMDRLEELEAQERARMYNSQQ